MFDQLIEWLNEAAKFANTLWTAEAGVLTPLTILAAGYVLRLQSWFPNKWIPLVSISIGVIEYPLLMVRPPEMLRHVFIARSIVVGFIIACATWALHYHILARIEARLPFLGKALTKMDEDDTPPPKDNNNGGQALIEAVIVLLLICVVSVVVWKMQS